VTIKQLIKVLRATQTPEEREQLEYERERWRREGCLPSYLAVKGVEEGEA
jgi:hypothetical protein